MALRAPEAPESDIQERYDQGFDSQGLSERERGSLAGVYAKNQEDIDNRRESMRNLQNLEGQASLPEQQNEGIADQEQQSSSPIVNKFTGKSQKSRGIKGVARSKKGIAFITTGFALGLLGFGGAFFFGGALAPIMMVQNITDDLNDQLSAIDTGTEKLFHKKIRPFTPHESESLGCSRVGSALSVKCKFSTMSNKTKQRLEAAGFKVHGEAGAFGRWKPTGIGWGNQTVLPGGFDDFLKQNPSARQGYMRANNMKFIGLRGDTFNRRVLTKFGIQLSPPELTGSHQDRVNKFLTITSSDGGRPITFSEAMDGDDRLKAADGTDGWYVDNDNRPDGERKVYTADEMNSLLDSQEKTRGGDRLRKPPTQLTPGQLNVAKSLSVLAVADTICDFRNVVGTAAVAAKIGNAAQLAVLSANLASLVGKMHSGDASPEDAEFIQKMFTDLDDRKVIGGIADVGGGNYDTPEGGIPNPNYGRNATDSELYKTSVMGGVPQTTAADKNYSLGFGADSFMKGSIRTLNIFDKVTGLGTDTAGCEIIQNKWTRGIGLFAGAVLGFMTFGGFSAINASANAALMAVLFFGSWGAGWILNSAMNNELITDTLIEQASVERGSAFWTGMSVILSQAALSRGMMPGTADQIVAYQVQQNTARQQYLALERQDAHPLDIRNPHSVIGTVAFSAFSHIPRKVAASEIASIPTSMASFVFSGFGSALKPSTINAASLDPERFKQCDDESYLKIGIDADIQCNIRYVMPRQSLDVDPVEVAEWMESREYVEEDTTTGYPKGYNPPEPQKELSIGKQFIEGIVDTFYDKRNYGGDDKKNEYGMFLDFCVYRAMPFGETYEEMGQFNGVDKEWRTGERCLETSDHRINMFRAYTFYKSVNEDLDEGAIVAGGEGSGMADMSNWPTAEDINALVERAEKGTGNSSPLNRKGSAFIELGMKYGINPGIIAAILYRESQMGADGSVLPNEHNNFAGITDADGDAPGPCGSTPLVVDRTWKKFCTPEEGLEGVFKILDLDIYRNTNGTMDEVMELYSPRFENDWNNMWEIFGVVAKELKISIEPTTNIYSNITAGAAAGFGIQVKEQAETVMLKSAIWGNEYYPQTQEFGPTFFSTQVRPEWYTYSLAYGFSRPGHTGIDIGTPHGTPTFSPVNGTVVTAGGTGYFTDEGGDGPGKGELKILTSDGHEVIFGHMSKIELSVGDPVRAGQRIGLSGTYNGPHIHLEYRVPSPGSTDSGWTIVDPLQYLKGVF